MKKSERSITTEDAQAFLKGCNFALLLMGGDHDHVPARIEMRNVGEEMAYFEPAIRAIFFSPLSRSGDSDGTLYDLRSVEMGAHEAAHAVQLAREGYLRYSVMSLVFGVLQQIADFSGKEIDIDPIEREAKRIGKVARRMAQQPHWRKHNP